MKFNILTWIDDLICDLFKVLGPNVCKWIKWFFIILLILAAITLFRRLTGI